MPIDTDTPILPFLVAETVIEQLEAYLEESLPAGYAERLTAKAEHLYEVNADWRKDIQARGNRGRDCLYVFMRHWLTAFIKKDSPALFARLPEGFWRGEHPVSHNPAAT